MISAFLGVVDGMAICDALVNLGQIVGTPLKLTVAGENLVGVFRHYGIPAFVRECKIIMNHDRAQFAVLGDKRRDVGREYCSHLEPA